MTEPEQPTPMRPDVWGDGPPPQRTGPAGSGPLDMSQDPDRVQVPGRTGPGGSGPLDLSQDPDRVQVPGRTGPGGSGPLDLSQDPDRVQVPGRTGPGGSGPLDLSQDPDRVQPGPPTSLLPPAPFPPGVALDPARDPDRVHPGDRTLVDLLGEGAQEEQRDGYVWLAGLLAVLVFLGLVAYAARFLGPG
ncbi:MAG: hypothetical protein JWN17_2866 [Frankiales bacterium]|nr:hypothetical protein [Frankiales bacterium]